MYGNTEFIRVREVDLSGQHPWEHPDIFQEDEAGWRVVLSGGVTYHLTAPDIEGDKPYNITVDDVELLYNHIDNELLWSISWSRRE